MWSFPTFYLLVLFFLTEKWLWCLASMQMDRRTVKAGTGGRDGASVCDGGEEPQATWCWTKGWGGGGGAPTEEGVTGVTEKSTSAWEWVEKGRTALSHACAHTRESALDSSWLPPFKPFLAAAAAQTHPGWLWFVALICGVRSISLLNTAPLFHTHGPATSPRPASPEKQKHLLLSLFFFSDISLSPECFMSADFRAGGGKRWVRRLYSWASRKGAADHKYFLLKLGEFWSWQKNKKLCLRRR